MKLDELKRRLRQAQDAEGAWRASGSDPDMRQASLYYDDELGDAAREALPDLIAAVEALRDLLCEMSAPVWDDPRIDYHEVQITKGEMEKCRAVLKRLGVE